MMKTIFKIITIGCLIFCFVSCSTSTKITIYGEPGTEIYTPHWNKIGKIDNSGKVSVSLSDDEYYPFLMSYKSGTGGFVPFALDYQYKKYSVRKVVTQSSFGVWLGAIIVGVVQLANDGSASDGVGVLMGVSPLTGLYTWLTYKKTDEYCYHYSLGQQTNQDMIMTKPQLDTIKSEKVIEEKTTSTPPSNSSTLASSSSSKKMASSNSTKTLSSSSSTKSFKDNAVKIEGTYVGTGVLKQGNETIESYSGIKVVIKKKTAEVVLVNVIESDGSKFFYSDGEYSIKKQPNGKYVLTLMDISTATIEIDVNNNMVYVHPRVNIDSSIYKLSIKAKKSML